MDPNATLTRIGELLAAETLDHDALAQACVDLGDWLHRDGFMPRDLGEEHRLPLRQGLSCLAYLFTRNKG